MEKESEWPAYKKALLIIGNPESNVGLCTLWTKKELIAEKISRENYLVMGQCYSKNVGISLMIRNILANKRINTLVLCGVDLNNIGGAIIDLKEKGIDKEHKVIGHEVHIESEIPTEAIEKFRKNVEVIDKRDIKDYKKLDEFLKIIPKKEPWGEPEIYPRTAPKAPNAYPSETTGFIVREKKVGDAWLKILDMITRFGHIKPSSYAEDQQEICSLMSIVSDEDPTNIDWKPYFQFSKKELEIYLPQLMTSNLIGDVSYTYGSRLRNFKGINQIDTIVNELRKAFFSRRAIAFTWDVEKDHDSTHSPCLDLIQSLGQEKLHMTAYIRSNDMFKAWPMNALALLMIHDEIAKKVNASRGDLIIISNSAHIYQQDWIKAEELLEKYPVKLERVPDPRGNIIIELENGKIKVSHLYPDGRLIGEFYAESAKEAYTRIAETQMISQISHALDIGRELEKAEIALKNNLNYVQDKPLELKKTL
jgi:thymidylate synthase